MKRLFLASCILIFTCNAFSQSKKVVKLQVVPPVKESCEKLVYPNPTEDIVNIPLSSSEDKTTILIFNSSGNLLDKKIIGENLSLYELSLADYSQGNYFIRVSSKERSITYLVIKK